MNTPSLFPSVTPLVPLELRPGQTVFVKLESHQRTGSIKGRTALGLLGSAFASGLLRPGDTVVESSSGNMGVALAELCAELDLRAHLVVDGKLPPRLEARMLAAGASVRRVPPDTDKSRLLDARLALVRSIATRPRHVWLNQYANPAAQAIHYATTGPELLHQMQAQAGGLDVFVAPISTGGTISGTARFLRAAMPGVEIVAADAVGSAIFGGRPGPRVLNGIGASIRPANVDFSSIDRHLEVTDQAAINECWRVRVESGLGVGGSSGAALVAAAQLLCERPSLRIAVLAPDGDESYADSLFDATWLREHGLTTPTT